VNLLYHGGLYQWIRYKTYANTEGKLMASLTKVPRDHATRVSIQLLKHKCTIIAKDNCIILKDGLMIWSLPSLARLALGPSGLWSRL
jgi:hypothetical protein